MKTDTQPTLNGLHHVTAVTAKAKENVGFYTRVLGMRMVKKTVNQDDVSAYHLFYADALGSAGTDLTFFDWAGIRTAQNGAGTVSETALRVLGGEESLNRWTKWFEEQKVSYGRIEERSGLPTLSFRDGEGQRLRLIAESREATEGEFHPWVGSPVPIESAIVGLGAVNLTVRDADETIAFLTDVLGFRERAGDAGVFETGSGGVGSLVRVEGSTYHGSQGAGGVHHVAWRVENVEQLLDWQRHLQNHGLGTSGKVDRHYFQSLYFRIPGGILFEIATDGPGFAADGEDPEHLGEKLALPPFLEPSRTRIEAGLAPLDYQPANRQP
ncbi:ring-cleaving dioxygenase [Phragmitibacter flavus]|uniref:Ring-cleaving dioxygenase n=1 Tax=Phragmitibacter flavus TaxID=2576071 RepID=A0A5R8KJC2_9BACT|nr:ring-cleaving dioxygenase [Phragmitibacter flavus]TLD72350.1 ring-cleaving dioxygenase [Phragmitibacter flavus]